MPDNKHLIEARRELSDGSRVGMRVEIQGMLPSAAELERLERLWPGITKQFMDIYEKQVDHRIELEKKALDSGVNNSRRGQIFAFILGGACLCFGFALVIMGKNAAGFSAIIGTAATFIGAFIYGTNSKRKERVQKSLSNPE